MKIRESGMPEEARWDAFFDVNSIFEKLEIDADIVDLAEIGCGYGTFTLPAAQMIKGRLYAFDIEEGMIEIVRRKLEADKIANVDLCCRDVLADTTGLMDCSVDYVMLFNLLHLENPLDLLAEAKRILKDGGKLGVIHWRSDIETPRGPSLSIRPKPETIVNWLEKSGFSAIRKPSIIEPYHFGVLSIK